MTEGTNPPSGASRTGPPPPGDAHVESRGRKIAAQGEGNDGVVADGVEAAEPAAREILRDSEERTLDPATVDHEDDGVIRRSSEETAEL